MESVCMAPSDLKALLGLPTTVVGGYLGSGKTSRINRWLQHPAHSDTAVLVNDLGAINIDAERLRRSRGRVIELTQGCLCCSLRDGLGEALMALARGPQRPRRLLIETSGMAIPLRVAEQVRLFGLQLEQLLLLVDLERIPSLWEDPWVGDLVQRQFEGVDLILPTKTDRLDPGELTQRQQWLQQRLRARQPGERPAPLVPGADALARSESWQQQAPLSRQALLQWLASLTDDLLRLKGEVWLQEQPSGPLRLDRVGERVQLDSAPHRPWRSNEARCGRLVAIRRSDAAPQHWPKPPANTPGSIHPCLSCP